MPTKPRILLVEDDAELASIYQLRMEAEGFEVRHCDNGEAALQTALDFKPNLILLDVMMPHVNGFDVLDIIHNTPILAGIKIVMLSALGQPSDIARGKELGADDYLVKSQTTIAEVMERLRFHLNLPPAAN